MRKPSVLFINRVYPPQRGATGRLLRDLAQAMAAQGWDVNVLATGTHNEDEKDGAVTVRRLKAGEGKSIFGYLRMNYVFYRAVKKTNKPSLIVTLTDPPMLVTVGARLARAKKCAHIHWCHDLYPDLLPALDIKFPRGLMKYFSKISRRALKSCDRVVVIGRCMEKHLVQTGVMAQRLTFIPNWADKELMPGHHVAPPERFVNGSLDLSKSLLMDTNPKFRVLYAGNLGKAHAVDTILQAALMLQMTHPEIEFTFVGDGAGHDHMAAERTRLGLENIRLLPFQPAFQLREMMQGGDIHLISMKNEAAGLMVPSKLYAALAAERPCVYVGPEFSEAAKVIRDYKSGTVVAHGDAQALAAAIVKYRMDGSHWFEAHKGAKRANEDFSAGRAIDHWIKCAKDVIGSSAS